MLRKIAYYSIIFFIAICMTFTMPVNALSSNSKHNGNSKKNEMWFQKQANFMIKKGIFKGDGHGEYSWKNNVKRGDMTLMIFRAFELGEREGDCFQDVSNDSYYYRAIMTAKALGIAKGDGIRFNPENNITIEEAIALIERAVNLVNTDKKIDLSDLYKKWDKSSYATREDIAVILYYILVNYSSDEETNNLDTICYDVSEGETANFDSDDFSDVFNEVNDDDLSYVILDLPTYTEGTLYYGYKSSLNYGSRVLESTKYFADSDDGFAISKITFVPYSDFEGTVNIGYRAYGDDGDSYSGKVVISVEDIDNDSYISDTVNYTTGKDNVVTFRADDFIDVFNEESNDELSYVKFTLPSYSKGRLYYNYTAASDYGSMVTAAAKYYADTDDGLDISKVSFVPYSNYTGTVTINYNAYDDDDDCYSGKVIIYVNDNDSDISDTVNYTTSKDTVVTFKADDFIDVFNEESNDELSYVKFTLPSYSNGKLYYNYTAANDYGSMVTAATKYYADIDDGLDISKISFVPYSNYTGTVTINYNAYDDDGDSYDGRILISVKDGINLIDTIKYTTYKNEKVTFESDDFMEAFEELTDDELSYVKFKLPSYTRGKLYYNYKSSSDYGSLVTEATRYYADSDDGLDISKITFVPYSNYTGTVTISYTASNGCGLSVTGTLKIVVKD